MVVQGWKILCKREDKGCLYQKIMMRALNVKINGTKTLREQKANLIFDLKIKQALLRRVLFKKKLITLQKGLKSTPCRHV